MTKDQINQLCRLPDITDEDAFALNNAALEVTRGLATFRDLLPKYGFRELQRLVRKLGRRSRTGKYAGYTLYVMRKKGQQVEREAATPGNED